MQLQIVAPVCWLNCTGDICKIQGSVQGPGPCQEALGLVADGFSDCAKRNCLNPESLELKDLLTNVDITIKQRIWQDGPLLRTRPLPAAGAQWLQSIEDLLQVVEGRERRSRGVGRWAGKEAK